MAELVLGDNLFALNNFSDTAKTYFLYYPSCDEVKRIVDKAGTTPTATIKKYWTTTKCGAPQFVTQSQYYAHAKRIAAAKDAATTAQPTQPDQPTTTAQPAQPDMVITVEDIKKHGLPEETIIAKPATITTAQKAAAKAGMVESFKKLPLLVQITLISIPIFGITYYFTRQYSN